MTLVLTIIGSLKPDEVHLTRSQQDAKPVVSVPALSPWHTLILLVVAVRCSLSLWTEGFTCMVEAVLERGNFNLSTEAN